VASDVTPLIPAEVRSEAQVERFSVTIDALIEERLRYFVYKGKAGKSAIVEVALAELFRLGEEGVLAVLARYKASRRRRP
jgi:hypothetical protein